MRNLLVEGCSEDVDMRFFKSSDTVVVTTVLILFVFGFVVYLVNRPPSPSFYIYNVSFTMKENARSISFLIKVERGTIELKELFINDQTVYNWSVDKRVIREGETANCTLNYRWRMGAKYVIKVVTTDDRVAEYEGKAPEIAPSIEFDVKKVEATLHQGSLKVKAVYRLEGNGIDRVHMILFTYSSFERSRRPILIFYDKNYMCDESLKRADAIINYFSKCNVTISKVDYEGLKDLSKNKPNVVLILVNPLKDGHGRRLRNSLPAPLIDPNGDGYLRDDSKYGKSLLYDWMKDKGLILVTVGTLQPHKRILYQDGVFTRAKDSPKPFDVHLFLTDATGERGIINGSFTPSQYTPIRISGTLGLPYREIQLGFDKNAIENYGLHYYGYGDYKTFYNHINLNLTLPVYIEVGEGGWLAMGDEEYWLSDEGLARELFLIWTQAVWNSKWIPYGWYWDSSCAFHEGHYGVLKAEGTLETELIPRNIVGDKIAVRILALAYSSELDRNLIEERIIELRVPS